jgi:hypothetical protein
VSIRQSDGTFDGKKIVLLATRLDSEHPARKHRGGTRMQGEGTIRMKMLLVGCDPVSCDIVLG